MGRHLTFAAIWANLSVDARREIAEIMNCSVPVLALTKINKWNAIVEKEKFGSAFMYDNGKASRCNCEACMAAREVKRLLGKSNRRSKHEQVTRETRHSRVRRH